MRKITTLIFLLSLLLCAASGSWAEQEKPKNNISFTEAKQAIQEASPDDGTVVPGPQVVIRWATRLSSDGSVQYRLVGSEKWKRISEPRNTLHQITLKKLSPGDRIEYRIIIEHQKGTLESEIRSFTIAEQGLVFTQREYEFEVERDYQQHCAVEIENRDAKAHEVVARVNNPHQDFIVGFVGEGGPRHTLTIESGKKKTLELVVHTQDAQKEAYPFFIKLNGVGDQSVQDSAQVTVHVNQLNFNVQAELGSTNPVTLGVTLKLHNQGDALTDFSILPDAALWERVKIVPQIEHARFPQDAYLKIQVLPILETGMRELSGSIVLSAGKQSKSIPLTFTVPEGKQVFCAVTQSVYQSSATTHFCTNRKHVSLDLDTTGNGPEEGHIRNTRDPYPKQETVDDDYILEKGEIDYRAIKENAKDFLAGGIFGDGIEDPNGYNLAGQMLVNSLVGWPADVRDVLFSGKKMFESGFQDHKLDFLLNVVGILPVAGDGLKAYGRYKNWTKYSDELADALPSARRWDWTDAYRAAPTQDLVPSKIDIGDLPPIRGPDVAEGLEQVGKDVGKNADEVSNSKDVIEESIATQTARKAWQKEQDVGKNIANEKRTTHILDGDETGGGHLWPGAPGKTPFPKEWGREKIMTEISNIATDSKLEWTPDRVVNGKQRYMAIKEIEGVKVKIVIEPEGEGIITAFPINEK